MVWCSHASLSSLLPMYLSHIVNSNALLQNRKTHDWIRYATFDELLTVYVAHSHEDRWDNVQVKYFILTLDCQPQSQCTILYNCLQIICCKTFHEKETKEAQIVMTEAWPHLFPSIEFIHAVINQNQDWKIIFPAVPVYFHTVNLISQSSW